MEMGFRSKIINSIKEQTRQMILCNSIEIGRRLAEAKLLVAHGEWGEWLKTYIDYSKSTANNLMRIFDEYGANQIPLFGDNSKSQALGNLSYTQAVALLGVPDKEEFIQENDIENMSTRELHEAIKAQKAAEKRADDAELREKELTSSIEDHKKASEESKQQAIEADIKANKAEEARKELEKTLKTERKQTKLDVERLTGLIETAKSNGDSSEKIQQLETELEEAQQQVQELTDKINEPVTIEATVAEKVPEAIEQELAELREKTKALEKQAAQSTDSIVKYTVYFNGLTAGFKNLLGALAEIEEKDPDSHEKYKKAVSGLLERMSESL